MDLTKNEPNEVADKYRLVHAFVTNIEGRTFPHGWLELDGKAIDSARSKEHPLIMDAAKYRDTMNAENIIEYTPVEAMIKAAREQNLGPWELNDELHEAFKRQPVDHSLPYDNHEDERFTDELGGRREKSELWRGPHEGRYLQLFLAGKKPAIIIDDWQMEPFEKYVESGELIKFPLLMPDSPQMTWEIFVLTIPGQEWRAKKIQSLYTNREQWPHEKMGLWHSKLGILLGYTNDDIRRFINIEYPAQ